MEVLGDVAERTPNDALYNRVVGEVAELASREVPEKSASQQPENDSVFFIQTARDGSLKLWVGAGDGQAHLQAIQALSLLQRPRQHSGARIRYTFSCRFGQHGRRKSRVSGAF